MNSAIKNNEFPKSEGFRIPEGYFTDFEQRMNREFQLREKLTPASEGFNIPAGYFESLEERLNQIPPSASSKVRPLTSREWFRYGAAASLLLFSGLSLWKLLGPGENQADFSSLESSEIRQYLNFNTTVPDPYELSSFFSEQELKDIALLEPSLDEAALIDYLMEHSDDTLEP